MEGIKEEAGTPLKKSNRLRRILKTLLARRNREKKVPAPVPWARIHEKRGTRTLFWGMGDGKTFGSVPLGPEAAFSADSSGVTIQGVSGEPVIIGRPEAVEENLLLARRIEKVLRNSGRRQMSLWAGFFILVFLVVLGASGGSDLGRLASLAQTLPEGSGGSDLSGGVPPFPPSMSSGLTCNVH